MRSTLHRLERQLAGARLVEDCEGPQPSAPKPERDVQSCTQPAERRATLHHPTMSAADRREAIATARKLQANGRTLSEIAKTLSVLPEIIESWLGGSPTAT